MGVVRGFGIAIGLVALILAAAAGAGVAAHSEAVVVSLEKEPAPLGTGAPVRLLVAIRNRTAALVPVRGVGRSPAWDLQRRTDSGEWERLTGPSESQIAWLEPYHQERHEVPVEAPGVVRAVVHSGVHGEWEHASDELVIEPDDFDHRPLAHY
jgi:hypothetical protein